MNLAKAQETLREVFGFETFRAGQARVIEALLEGRGAAAVFPTGAGKSLCYQLPALLLDGVTLVVSPLLALMKDQVDSLTRRGVAAARLDSTLQPKEVQEILRQAREGHLKLLYVAPERFQNERFRHALEALEIALFAVDEAHCVSEWGHNFRPDYLKLAAAASRCRASRVLALTATATPRVLDDICRAFAIEERIRTPFFRPNLVLNARVVESPRAKFQQLGDFLGKGPTVVYVTLQRSAEELASRLAGLGYPARPYHAGLDAELRAKTQEWFLASPDGVVVATIAFGMGIDKSDIRAIVHYDPPKSLESYSQEIGRAGRDGQDAHCGLLFHPPDRIPLENFVFGDTPTREAMRGLFDELFSGSDDLVLNLLELGNRHDIRPLVLRTLLTYLELDGHLEERTPVFTSYSFKPLCPSQEMLATLQGEPRDFLAGLFRLAIKKKIWFALDIDRAERALGCRRERVIKALDFCQAQGWLELRATDLRHRYRVLRRPQQLQGLVDELYQRGEKRERAELERLDQALSLATGSGCLAARLSGHFGESLPDGCGRCSHCRGEHPSVPFTHPVEDFELPPLPQELGATPRQAARFLCGVSSPALSRGKWTRDPRFGSLGHVPFGQVLAKLSK